MHKYLLKYETKLYVPDVLQSENSLVNYKLVATFLKNIEQLGYTFSKDLIIQCQNLIEGSLFFDEILAVLKKMVGADVEYKPMYPNFPWQVMRMDEAELYLNALFHYFGDWIGVRVLPEYEKESRSELTDFAGLKIIELGREQDVHDLFRKMMMSKVALSDSMKADLKAFLLLSSVSILPSDIPIKENLAFIMGVSFENPDRSSLDLLPFFKTATDVLRLVTALSGGDISLATNTKFKKFKRRERKRLLFLLDHCSNLAEDMYSYKNKWLRLAEIIHPGQYKQYYPRALQAFQLLWENEKVDRFNSRVEKYLIEKDWENVVQLLKSRPTLFARRLDQLLRGEQVIFSLIYQSFASVIDKVSTSVLLQLQHHFKVRNEKKLRVFFPKGNVAKVQAINNDLSIIPVYICSEIMDICQGELIDRFSVLPQWNNVFLDPDLRFHHIPFALRSASESLNNLTRGSREYLQNSDTIRFFIHWKDKEQERVDVDLSAILLDVNYQYVQHVSYTNLKSERGMLSFHSGDLTSAPTGAAEFLDIDLSAVKGAYIVMVVNSYTQQPFNEIPECFAGWMNRTKPNSGEIFEPRTVHNRNILTAETKISIPLIIDIENFQVIWTDIALKSHPNHENNIHENLSNLGLMTKAMVLLSKPNLYELFWFHATGRSKALVTREQDADLVITKDTFSHAEILADFL